jgi:hypothetical protein
MSKFQSFVFVVSVVGAALMTGAASAQTAAPAANAPTAPVNAPPTGAPVAKAQSDGIGSWLPICAQRVGRYTIRRNSAKHNCLESRSWQKNFCDGRDRKGLCVQPAWRLRRWIEHRFDPRRFVQG